MKEAYILHSLGTTVLKRHHFDYTAPQTLVFEMRDYFEDVVGATITGRSVVRVACCGLVFQEVFWKRSPVAVVWPTIRICPPIWNTLLTILRLIRCAVQWRVIPRIRHHQGVKYDPEDIARARGPNVCRDLCCVKPIEITASRSDARVERGRFNLRESAK